MPLINTSRIKQNVDDLQDRTKNYFAPIQQVAQPTIAQPQVAQPNPITNYTNKATQNIQSSMLPQLNAPKPLTTAGDIYQQRVTSALTNPDPVSLNAQQSADTNMARRNYLTRKQTQENLAKSPFGAGSAQYQRAMDESMAGANIANLGEQNQANAVRRGQYEMALNRATGLEDNVWSKAVGERTNQQANASRFSTLIEDPKAKYAFNRLVASGVDPQTAYQNIVGETGTIQEQYQGLSPIGSLAKDAEEWISRTTDLQPGTPEFNQAVRDRMIAIDESKQQPLDDATTQRSKQDIIEKLRRNEPLTDEEKEQAITTGVAVEVTLETIKKGASNVQKFLESNPSGLVNIGGEIYKVESGGRATTSWEDNLFGPDQPRHTDYVKVIDDNGNTKYIWGGKIQDNPPKSVERSDSSTEFFGT